MKKPKQLAKVSDEQIDEWLKAGRKPEDVNALLKQFTKRVVGAGHAGGDGRTLGVPCSRQAIKPLFLL